MAQLIDELLPVMSVEAAEDFTLKLTFPSGATTTMFLGTIFAEVRKLEGPARSERIRRAVLASAPAARPSTWPDAAGRILPAVRAMSWVAAAGGTEGQPMWRPLAPFLVAVTAINNEYGMSFVTEADRRRWDVDEATIEGIARENLRRVPPPTVGHENGAGVDIVGPDGYTSSWLAAPATLAEIGGRLPGDDFVALAPSRDTLRLVAVRNRHALRDHLDWALSTYQTAPRPLSPVPYQLFEGRLAPWDPPSDDRCRSLVDRAGHLLAAVEYGQQHRALTALFEKTGENVFVAEYKLMDEPGMPIWSWAAWVKQVTAGLLPRTDHLALADAETKTSLWVPWEDAERLAPTALRIEPGYFPPRWRVSGWPQGSELEQLRAVAFHARPGEGPPPPTA